MKIVVLTENTTINPRLKKIHGLSIYIETEKHKLLFDLGPDDTFYHNAGLLGIDLTHVDTVVISHGHYDHGGGISRFLEINDKAKIYIKRQAFEPYYHKTMFVKSYIGLGPDLLSNERVILTDDIQRIADEIFIFSDVKDTFDSKSSRSLLKKTNGKYEPDDFIHEQNLILTSEGQTILFTGCSHKGIANILRTADRHIQDINMVLGGFHLYNPITKIALPKEVLTLLATTLTEHNAIFYTGHCTGEKAYTIMKQTMGERLKHLSTGTIIEIPSS